MHSGTRAIRRALHFFRSAAGAIDLASIMVGVLVIGIIGGVIAATVFAVIPWAQDNSAKSSLDSVQTAQSVSQVKDGKYQDWAGLVASKYVAGSATVDAVVNAAGDCYVTSSVSATGTSFYKTSRGGPAVSDKAGAPDTSWCVNSARLLADPVINLASNPNFTSAAPGTTVSRTNFASNPRFTANTGTWYDWNGNVSGASVWDGGTPGALGGSSLKVTPSANGAGVELMQALPLLSDYRVSFYAKGATALPAGFGARVHPGGPSMTAVGSPVNGWQRYASSKMTLNGTQAATYINVFASAGQTFWISNVLVEQTDQLRDYFDGSTADAYGVDNGWSGAADNSASVARTGSVVVRKNLTPNPSAETDIGSMLASYGGGAGTLTRETTGGYSGASFARATWTTASTGISGNFENNPYANVPAGNLTLSTWVRVNQPQRLQLNLTAGAAVNATFTAPAVDVPANVWTRLTYSAPNAAAGSANMRVIPVAGGFGRAWSAGDTLDADAWLMETSPIASPYFDGSTPASGDTFNEWSGTGHGSPSNQLGVAVAGVALNASAGGGSSTYQSLSGSTQSVTLRKMSGHAFSRLQTLAGLKPDTKYTYSVNVSSPTATTTRFVDRGPTESGYYIQDYAINSTPKRITRSFTTGASETTRVLDVGVENSQAATGSLFTFDDYMLVEGTYTGEYFDGNSPNGEWNGPINASSSTGWVRR